MEGKTGTFPRTVAADGFSSVSRTRRIETAHSSEKRGEGRPVRMDAKKENARRNRKAGYPSFRRGAEIMTPNKRRTSASN
jgi:hypothetical protein